VGGCFAKETRLLSAVHGLCNWNGGFWVCSLEISEHCMKCLGDTRVILGDSYIIIEQNSEIRLS